MDDHSLYHACDSVREITEKGAEKGDLSLSRLLFSGFMAGAYIAFGFFLSIVAAASFSSWAPQAHYSLFRILLGLFFPLGLFAVVVGGAELWTGNVQFTGTASLQGRLGKRRTLYNWVASYTGNFAGAFFLAFLVTAGGGIITSNRLLGEVVTQGALGKASGGFFPLFWLGLGCNWLVNLAIWLYMRGKETGGKLLLLWFPIFAFVAMGFEHSIANMWIFSSAALLPGGGFTWGMAFHNLVPVTAGNAIGGFVFVSFYHWFLCTGRSGGKKLAAFLWVTVIFVLVMGGLPLLVLELFPLLSGHSFAFPLIYLLYGGIVAFSLSRVAKPAEKEKRDE